MAKFDEVLDRYVPGRVRNAKWYRALCCFHAEDTPSLDIDRESGGYKCLGCKKTGFFSDVVAVYQNMDRQGASRMIESMVGGNVRSGRSPRVFSELIPSYLDPSDSIEKFLPVQSKKYVDYLKRRNITVKTAKMLNLREGNILAWNWGNRIAMPIYDINGNLCSLEGRTITDDPQRYWKWKGSMSNLGVFGIQLYANRKRKMPLCFVVEGGFDQMSVLESGYPCVALSCSDISDVQLKQLKQIAKRFVFLFDHIPAKNRIIFKEVVERFKEKACMYLSNFEIANTPKGDPNSLHQKNKLVEVLKKYE